MDLTQVEDAYLRKRRHPVPISPSGKSTSLNQDMHRGLLNATAAKRRLLKAVREE